MQAHYVAFNPVVAAATAACGGATAAAVAVAAAVAEYILLLVFGCWSEVANLYSAPWCCLLRCFHGVVVKGERWLG